MVDGQDELPEMLTDRPVFMCSSLTSIILSEGRAVKRPRLILSNKPIGILAGAACSSTHGQLTESSGFEGRPQEDSKHVSGYLLL